MQNRPNNPIPIEALRRRIARLEGARHRGDDAPVPSGWDPLDRLLPEGGFRRGTLVEWLADGEGSGVETLAMVTAGQACRRGGALVVLDGRREFYPPAAARLGIELQNLIVVHATSEADSHWALDQVLRCPGVSAVLAWPDEFGGKLDGRTFRRLQLAAEQGGGLGLLIRPQATRHEPSWADVRLLVEPLPPKPVRSPWRRLRIHLLRCRGAINGRSVDVEIDDETRTVHLAARLADPTPERRAAGA